MNRRRADLGGLLVLLLGSVAWTVCTFHDLAYRPHGDWDQYLTFFEIQRRAILVDGAFPDWNPYLLGGIPGAAHPQFNCTSPYFAPLLLFGLLPGTAVYFGLHFLTAVTGVLALGRRLGRSVPACLVAAVVFGSFFAPFVGGGVVNRVNGSLLPWFWFALLGRHGLRSLLAQAAILALLFLEGGFYSVLGAGLSVGLLALCTGSAARAFAVARRSALALGFAAMLAAVRLIPTVQLYVEYPRETLAYAGRPLLPESWSAFVAKLSDLPAALGALLQSPFLDRRDILFGQPIFVGVDLGIAVAAVLILGLFLCRRPVLWLATSLLLLLCLGAAAPLDLWSALKRLPGLHSFDLPMSLLFAAATPLVLIVAETLDRAGARLARREHGRALLLAGFGVLGAWAPQLHQQWTLLADRPVEDLPARSTEPFRQTTGVRMRMLASVLRNEGVVDAYEEVIRGSLVVAAKPDQPAFDLQPPRTGVELADERAGRLGFVITAGPATTVRLDQNHASGWEAVLGGEPLAVRAEEGRVAVDLEAGRAGRLELRYTSSARRLGQWISLLGGILFAGLCATAARRPSRPMDDGAVLRTRLGGRDEGSTT